MRKKHLGSLATKVRAFFKEFAGLDFKDISPGMVQQYIDKNGLTVETFQTEFGQDSYAPT